MLHATRFAATAALLQFEAKSVELSARPDALIAAALLLLIAIIVLGLIWWDVRRSGQHIVIYIAFRVVWLFSKLWHGVRHSGPDPLPAVGPVLLISNHTSPADPFFIQSATRRVISFMMAREYFSIRPLQPVFRLSNTILVNRTGRDTAATKAAVRAARSGGIIGIFPEGGIHLDPKSLGPAKPGAAMLALLTRVPVIPAFVDRPRHSNKLSTGILVPANARVVFGRPIDLSEYYERGHDAEVLREVSERMMAAIASLRPTRPIAD